MGALVFWFSRELIGAGTNEKPEGGSSWSPPSAVHERAQFFWPPQSEREGGRAGGGAAGGGAGCWWLAQDFNAVKRPLERELEPWVRKGDFGDFYVYHK